MPENLRDHGKDMADTTLNATELVVALSQPNNEIHQDDTDECMNESDIMITDGSDSFIDDVQAKINNSSIVCIQVDADKNDKTGRCADKLTSILESPQNTSEIPMEHDDDFKNDVSTCDEKTAVETEENIKDTITQPLTPETTSSKSLSESRDALSDEPDTYFEFTTLFSTLEIDSEKTHSNFPRGCNRSFNSIIVEKLSKTFVKRNSFKKPLNSIASNKKLSKINNAVLDLGTKKTNSTCYNKESSSIVQRTKCSSGTNKSKSLKIRDDRTCLRHKKSCGLGRLRVQTDSELKPGSSKDFTEAKKCQRKYCSREGYFWKPNIKTTATPKETISSFQDSQLSPRVEQFEDSSSKNEFKPEETSNDPIDVRHKTAGKIKSDGDLIPRSSKDSPATEKCQAIVRRRTEVHDPLPSCILSSIIRDLNNNNASDNIKTKCKRLISSDRSLEKRFKNTQHEGNVSNLATKISVKRNCDSQSDGPSTKHRRRCTITGSAEVNAENKSKHHFRFISDDKKCVVDKGTGHAGSSTDNFGVFQSGKRKIDKEPDTF